MLSYHCSFRVDGSIGIGIFVYSNSILLKSTYVCMYESTTTALPMLSTLAVSLAMSTWSTVIIFTATQYLFASSIVCEV